MKGLNKVCVIGNLGKDVELRRLQNGDAVANFSLAVNESWKDKTSGEKRESVEWVRVVAWGKVAEIAEKYLRKGSACYIEGKLKTRKYTDNSNIERWITEVVLSGFGSDLILLGDAKGNGVDRDAAQDYREASDGGGDQKPKTKRDEMNDEIPF